MPTAAASKVRWHVAADAAAWLDRARAMVAGAEASALASRGVFHIVLAGGRTPGLLYQALAEEPHDWARWQVWFGDERVLPPGSPERNSRMARSVWLDKVGLPAEQVHDIPAERGSAAAAGAYAELLAGVGDFDLVLLGIGEDGHTASLFPGRDWGEDLDGPDVLAVDGAPKPPAERVSLSARRLSRARGVLFLATGADKRSAIRRWRRGEYLPVAAIRPPAGVDVLLDPDASPNGEA